MALDTRAAAAQIIGDVLAGKSLNQALPPRLAKVAPRDRGLLQQLCYGTLRLGPRLQDLLGQLLDKPLRDKDRDVQGLLLCGLYQLENTRIPDHAGHRERDANRRGILLLGHPRGDGHQADHRRKDQVERSLGQIADRPLEGLGGGQPGRARADDRDAHDRRGEQAEPGNEGTITPGSP